MATEYREAMVRNLHVHVATFELTDNSRLANFWNACIYCLLSIKTWVFFVTRLYEVRCEVLHMRGDTKASWTWLHWEGEDVHTVN